MNSASQKELASAEYWDKHYRIEQQDVDTDAEDSWEWFKTFVKWEPFPMKTIPPAKEIPQIVHLGCGKSVREKSLFAWKGKCRKIC
jgi:hypothetical protein